MAIGKLRNMKSEGVPRIQRRTRRSSLKSLRNRDGGSSFDNKYPVRLLNNYGKFDPNFPNPRHINLNRVNLTDELLGALSERVHGGSLTVNCCNIWKINNSPSPRIKVSEFAVYGDEESGSFNAVVICQIWTWLASILDHESLRAVYVDADADSTLKFLKTVSTSTQISFRLECLEMITYEEFKWKELYLCLNHCTALRRLRIVGDKPPKPFEFNESARLQCRLHAYDGPIELIPFVFNSYETLVSLSLTARSESDLADRYIVDKLKMYRDKLPMHTIRFLRVYVGRLSLGPLLKDVSTLFVNLEALQISTRFSQYGSLPIRPAELYKVLITCNRPRHLRYLDIEGLLYPDCVDKLMQMGFKSLECPFVRLSEMTLDDRVEEIWLNELTIDQKAHCLDELRQLLTAGVHPQFCPIDRF